MDNLEKLKNMYSWIDNNEWSCTTKGNKFSLLNNYTKEEFSPERVLIYSEHIRDIYKARSANPLPQTPKLILAEYQKEKKSMQMLVQRAYNGFA